MRTLRTMLTLALAASLLAPMPSAEAGSSILVRMEDYRYRPRKVGGLSTNPDNPSRAHPIVWRNDGNTLHDVREDPDQEGIRVRTPDLDPGASSGGLALTAAATYRYVCTYHPQMTGIVKVRPALYPDGDPGNVHVTQGPGGKAIVRLRTGSLPDDEVMDLQRKRGAGSWKTIATGTRRKQVGQSPNTEGVYTFRARIRHTSSGGATTWSPVSKKLTVT